MADWAGIPETVAIHGLDADELGWPKVTRMAADCPALDENLRGQTSALAGAVFTVASLKGEFTVAEAMTELPRIDPALWARVEEAHKVRQARSQLSCDAAKAYRDALTATGMAMLGGRKGARQYVAARVATLPAGATALAPFFPSTKAYSRLLQARAQYAALVESGGFPTLEKTTLKLKRGKKGKAVAALRERLRKEGFGEGKDSGVFDGPLEMSLKIFQAVHMLPETGKPGKATLKRLNVSAAHKLRRIDLALANLRAGPAPWDPSFLLVQAPHGFLELYLDGSFVRQFRTVLGSAKKAHNEETGRREFAFRTLPVSSVVKRIIFNPEWIVPDSIAKAEIEPRLEEDPGYLGRNGYRIFEYKGGKKLYIQGPGKGNALGRVKFLFPNDYGYYLHDTSQKHLFKKRRRLFSHGCVRVRHALELAALILARDRGYTWDKIRNLLRHGDPYEVKLVTPIPIYVIYSTVAADSHGRLLFMPDVYRLEKAEQDLGVAGFLLGEGTAFFAAIGFHGQQAVEKYLKALLVRFQVEFRKTHDLADLLDLIAEVDEDLAGALSEVTVLNPFGVEARYPGDVPEITLHEAEQAVKLARVCGKGASSQRVRCCHRPGKISPNAS